MIKLVRKSAPIIPDTDDVTYTSDTKNREIIGTIGSFDIGVKNLGVCIIDKYKPDGVNPNFKIRKWELISLVDQVGKTALKCKHKISVKKKDRVKGQRTFRYCGVKANKWNSVVKVGYCGTHAKSHDAENLERYTTTKNVTDMELNRSLIMRLREFPELWRCCDRVVIEAQKTSKMKKIVFMIMSFLTHQKVIDNENNLEEDGALQKINVVSASHKLAIPVNKLGIKELKKLPDTTESGLDKSSYEGRKKLAQEHSKIILQHDQENLKKFNESRKKDDLADSFLQGLCYLLKN